MAAVAWVVGLLCFLFLLNSLMFSLAKPIAAYHFAVEVAEGDAPEKLIWAQYF